MTSLHQHIKQTYGSVYRAAKDTKRTETQLRNWIKKGAHIDGKGVVWFPGGELHPNTTNNSDT